MLRVPDALRAPDVLRDPDVLRVPDVLRAPELPAELLCEALAADALRACALSLAPWTYTLCFEPPFLVSVIKKTSKKTLYIVILN